MTTRQESALPDRRIALVDLLDRLLAGGVVLTGDVMLSIADVDLVRINLRAVIVSVSGQTDGLWGPVLRAPGEHAGQEGGGRA